MQSAEIRERFLIYFERGGLGSRAHRDPMKHQRMPSAPLVLPDDPTLLFTNAGMAPFKKYFLGSATPPAPRLTSCQKCLRTSDIARVGSTPRHLTFFEMLGNFSFGDYFKEGAIELAWGLLTDRNEGFGLPPSRLWVTVFEQDPETADWWQKIAGIRPSRILLRGEDDNFWKMGDTGPCGPCTEILYDFRGPDLETPPNEDRDEAVEIWNLVLMQFNRKADGTLEPLPRQNVDTGAGLERLAWVLQNKPSVFETDLLYPLYRTFYEYLSDKMQEDIPDRQSRITRRARISADHLRAASFAIASNWDSDLLESFFRDPDLAYKALAFGIRPGNTGRNYVVRQLVRRGMLALTTPDDPLVTSASQDSPAHRLASAFSIVKQIFAATYSEILVEFAKPEEGPSRESSARERPSCHIGDLIEEEASAFSSVIAVVLRRFHHIVAQLPNRIFPGTIAFELHDTYGFPVELTRELSEEYGLTLDEVGFRQEMERQRARARAARAKDTSGWSETGEPTPAEFVGYELLTATAQITYLRWRDAEVQIALDRTPFYAEAGGQVGDAGLICLAEGNTDVVVRVEDTIREIGTVLHIGKVLTSTPDIAKALPVGAVVVAEVDSERRLAIRRAHTATHLLHRALRNLFGETATQAGSLVAPDFLRFDFHYGGPLTNEHLESLERQITLWILEDHPVRAYYRSFQDAMAEGVTALFGEKYGETVRVLEVVGVSKELCGGTHLDRTLQVGPFKVTSEESIGAGIRRIQAVTGFKALDWIQFASRSLTHIARDLNTSKEDLINRWERLKEELKYAQKDADRWRARYLATLVQTWSSSPDRVVTDLLEEIPAQNLSEAASAFVRKNPTRAIAVGSAVAGRAVLVLSYGERFEAPIPADSLIKQSASLIGGGGGGRARFAQAGGTNPSALMDALHLIKSALS
ncbi:MAG: alanine--tRNA ligase [bacterium JZ-2024 1]